MRRAAAVAALLVACSAPAGGPPAPAPTSSTPVVPTPSPSPTPATTTTATPERTAAPATSGDGPTCWTASIEDPRAGTPSFEDATDVFGLVDPLVGMHGHAAAFGHLDADPVPDLVVGTFGDRSPDHYAVRGADGPSPDRLLRGGSPFSLVGDVADELPRTSGAVFADLDGDGDADLLLVRHGDDTPPSVVLENRDGELEPVAEPLPDEFNGRTPAVADFDGDGLLDVYVSEDRYGEVGGVLLHNRGGFAFDDVTDGSGLEGIHALGATAGDLDRDGHADLVTSERVLLGGGDLTFDDVTPDGFAWEQLGADDDPAGVAIGDVDLDRVPDIVVGQHYRSIVEKDEQVPVRLFRGTGADDGPAFVEVTDEMGLDPLPTLAPHVELADLDNDGRPDLVTSGSADDGDRPAVFRNTPEGFVAPDGLGSTQYWVGTPVVDVDLDGRLDLFALEWEPTLPSRLFRNTGPVGHWLAVSVDDPVGGVGTVVEAATPDGQLVAWREIGVAAGYASGGPPVAHLGLGTAEVVDVTIVPPRGEPVVLEDVAADQHLRWPDGC